MRLIDVVNQVGQFEGTPAEYALKLFQATRKAGIPRPIRHLKFYFFYRFRYTRADRYAKALHFVSCLEMYVKAYNSKGISAREKALYRRILRGYNIL